MKGIANEGPNRARREQIAKFPDICKVLAETRDLKNFLIREKSEGHLNTLIME